MLADEEVDLVEQLKPDQDEDPPAHLHLEPHASRNPMSGSLPIIVQTRTSQMMMSSTSHFEAVPEGQLAARQDVFFSRAPARESKTLFRPRGLVHVGLPTVNEDMMVFMLF